MALHVKQNENSHIGHGISADISTRLNKRAQQTPLTHQPVIMDRKRKTTGGGAFWTAIASVVITAILVYLMFIF